MDIKNSAAPETFTPFSEGNFKLFLEHFPLTVEGLQYWAAAYKEPSRNVQGSTKNLVGDTPCPKMRMNAQSESGTGEHPFTLLSIFNKHVLGYINQPKGIPLDYKGRNNSRVRSVYTPDSVQLDWIRGACIEEWKHANARETLEIDFPGKYKRDKNGNFTLGPIADAVGAWGYSFRVRFSDEVTAVGHANRKYLRSYLYPRDPDDADINAFSAKGLLQFFGEKNAISLSDLKEACGDIDLINWSIATGHLHINWDLRLIEREPGLVTVFDSAEALAAWSASVRPDGSRPTLDICREPESDLKPGEKFLFDGRALTVQMVGSTAYHCMDEIGQYVSLTKKQLLAAIYADLVVLPRRGESEAMASPLWGASLSNFMRAERRMSVLRKLDSGEILDRDEVYSPATVRRWRKAVKEGLAKGISEFESLLDECEDRGFKGTHIDAELSQWLNECITLAISKKINKSLNVSFGDIEKLVSAMGFTMISKSSFYERASALRTVKTIRNAMGQKHAYKVEPSYWMLDQDTPIHGTRALAEVHFDSTLLDIEVRSSLSGDILGRPWLTLALCANTRRVVGMHLSFRPPGYISSMMVLADIVRRFGRLPDCVIHDWGSEFKARAWKFALTALQIERFVRPKSAPRFGAVIERFFGVVTRELLENLAGNTKLRKDVRSLSPGADPSTHSGLWLMDLAYGLEEFFFEIYDTRKHPTTLMKPRDAYDTSIMNHGARLHRLRKLHQLLPILMPTAKGRPRSIDPSRGVWVNYRYYGHPSLTALSLKGMTLMVKPLPHDPTRILGCIEGKWVYLNSNLSERLSRVPESVRMCIYEELQMEHLLVASSHAISKRRRTELIESMNSKALANLEYWKEPELRRFLALADFDGCPPQDKGIAPPQGSRIQELDLMMQRAFANVMGETES